MDQQLNNKRILVGVTGSIAAYKACELIRRLRKSGAEVRVIQTEASKKFVCPLTFETLSDHEVISDLFPANRVVKTRHISVAEWADCFIICPATANIVAKVRNGIADDFLSTAISAARAPVIFAPAMDYEMAANPVYLDNCDTLKKFGYRFIDSEEGELASGAIGKGRLATLSRVVDSIKSVVLSSDSLKGQRVLVTAGPTLEWLDPVRYISNASSGKMGYALAEEAALRGAEVTLISGPTQLHAFDYLNHISVESAAEMAEVVLRLWPDYSILVQCAAVSDFRPGQINKHKIKKKDASLTLKLEENPDILKQAASVKGDRLVIGFALETQPDVEEALRKCHDKNLDIICLNTTQIEGGGIGSDFNRITLIESNGKKVEIPLMPKWEIAQKIWEHVKVFMG